MNDPLRGLFPTHERDHPPPTRPRPCPACRRAMQFTHYGADRVELGSLLASTRFYAAELAGVLGLLLLSAVAAVAFGVLAMAIALLLAAPLAYLWIVRRIEASAVWRCAPCDRYYAGPGLRPWKAP